MKKRPIPQYSPIPHGITELFTRIIGIPLDGVDRTPVAGFHNSHMVSYPIAAPVEVNNRTGSRDAIPILPLPPRSEPLHPGGAVGMLRDHAGLNIAALLAAPAYKAGAPLHTGAESIPAPIELSAHIAHLAQGHGHNIVAADTRHG